MILQTLLDATTTPDNGSGIAQAIGGANWDKIKSIVNIVLYVLLGVSILVTIFTVSLKAIKLSQAEDPQERSQIKKSMIHAIIAPIIIATIGLIGLIIINLIPVQTI